MAYIGAGITRFNTADELTVTGTSEFGGNVSFGDNNITNVGSLQIDSIAGDADTNTNITFAGSDVITMTTAGSERLRITSAGSVGIGTTSPGGKLAIFDSTSATFRLETPGVVAISHSFDGTDYTINNNDGSSGHNIIFGSKTAGAESMRIDSSGRVGIGTSSPSASLGAGGLHVTDRIAVGTGSVGTPALHPYTDTDTGLFFGTGVIAFGTGGNERLRIDSSGNLLVGKTATGLSTTGFQALATGNQSAFISDGDRALILNRKTSDGSILEFRKDDSTTVGSIGTASGDLFIGNGNTCLLFDDGTDLIRSANASGGGRDATTDLGNASNRFKDLYLSGGAYIGGTGSANKLDDYEEGTWTPAYSGTGGATTHTYTQQIGRYVKIGELVHVYFALQTSASSGGSGSAIVTGLPFTISTALYASGSVGFATAFTADDGPTGILGNLGNTTMFLYKRLSNSNQTNLSVNDFATGNANELYASVTYKT